MRAQIKASSDPSSFACDTLVIPFFKDKKFNSDGRSIDKASKKYLGKIVASDEFSGKAGEVLSLPLLNDVAATRVVIWGLGEKNDVRASDICNTGSQIDFMLHLHGRQGQAELGVVHHGFVCNALAASAVAHELGGGCDDRRAPPGGRPELWRGWFGCGKTAICRCKQHPEVRQRWRQGWRQGSAPPAGRHHGW